MELGSVPPGPGPQTIFVGGEPTKVDVLDFLAAWVGVGLIIRLVDWLAAQS